MAIGSCKLRTVRQLATFATPEPLSSDEMEIPLAPLPRSESKTRFMARLGLDIRDARHRQVYSMMKVSDPVPMFGPAHSSISDVACQNEASEGRERIIESLSRPRRPSPGNVLDNSSNYSTSQIQEVVFNAEIIRIHQMAQPATRIMYDLANDPSHPNEPNWIIRWMLWHVFRYRDGRQKDGKGPERDSSSHPSENDEDGGSGPGRSSSVSTMASARMSTGKPMGRETGVVNSTDELTPLGPPAPSQRSYFDPVRDQYRD